MGYAVIGDVHGQDGKLKLLLAILGYRVRNGAWRHPEGRVAVFVGDLIDRGPGQVEVLRIVRRMQAAGSAVVIMGNHELNAIGYATRGDDGGWLRRHSRKNAAQHAAFLAQIGRDTPGRRDAIEWFRSLPVAVDLGGIRVCHAWWDDDVTTFRAAAIVPEAQRGRVPDVALPPGTLPGNPSPVPVFVGHYWFSGTPAPQNANTAVLDYGAGLDGPLVAYRWDGEPVLERGRFVAA